MNLHGVVALEAGVNPLLSDSLLEIVGDGFGEWKIPERLFRGNIEQADMTRLGCAGFSYPLDAKMHSVAAIGQADDLVEFELGFYASQGDAFTADVDRNRFLGEHLATAVGAEDSYRHLDIMAKLATFTHPCSSLCVVSR
jgi:hypothetical protein